MPARPDAPVPAEAGGPGAPFIARFIATGAGCGYFPVASGTVGSAAALLLLLIPGISLSPWFPALIVAAFFAGRWASDRVARADGHRLQPTAAASKRFFGQVAPAHPDPSIVVIDEFVGMWVSLLFIPAGAPAVLVAFTTFRIFDIVKPPPAGSLERAGRGWGIMLDDVAAGVYANIATRVTLWLIG